MFHLRSPKNWLSYRHPLEEGLGLHCFGFQCCCLWACQLPSSIRRRIRTFWLHNTYTLMLGVSYRHPLEEGLGLSSTFSFHSSFAHCQLPSSIRRRIRTYSGYPWFEYLKKSQLPSSIRRRIRTWSPAGCTYRTRPGQLPSSIRRRIRTNVWLLGGNGFLMSVTVIH